MLSEIMEDLLIKHLGYSILDLFDPAFLADQLGDIYGTGD